MTDYEYKKLHRSKNIEKYRLASRLWSYRNREKMRLNEKKYKEERKALLFTYKDNPCKDCSGRFPVYVMDFDHRPGTIKLGEVGRLAYSWTVERFMEEVNKCDLVCANCHRIRTFTRLQCR